MVRCEAPPSEAAFPPERNPEFEPLPPSIPTLGELAAAYGSGGSLDDRSGSGKEASSSGSSGGGVEEGGSLPLPLQLVVRAYRGYGRALKEHPTITKALTSFVGFAIGDRIAQSIGAGPFDPFRLMRLSLYGLLIDGPVGHAWYKLLDKHVYPEDPTCNKAVLLKTAADQLIWAPAMTIVFFTFLKGLESPQHPELILQVIQEKFVRTVVANYMIWPAVHIFNFKYVPTDWRIPFNNVVAIAWTALLSFICHSPPDSPGGSALGGSSTPLSGLPCQPAPGLLHSLHLTDNLRQTMAVEKLLSSWGSQAVPNPDLLVSYLGMKLELMSQLEKVCPIVRSPL